MTKMTKIEFQFKLLGIYWSEILFAVWKRLDG